jgi:hypothetical protein
MQITLVQAEIETAIRNHVLEQMSVDEGMELTIDLKATRGALGYQAIINIYPEGQAPVAEAPASTGSTTRRAPKASGTVSDGTSAAATAPKRRGRPPKVKVEETATEAAAEAAPATESAAPAVETAAAEETAPTASQEPEATVAEEAPAAEVTTEQIGGASEAPAAPRRSLFGGMTAPVNSAPADA